MAKPRGVSGTTGANEGLGSATDAGKAPRKQREGISLPLSKEATEGVKALANGFGMPQSNVVKDLAERVDRPIAQYLRELYEKYEAKRREKLGGLFGKPEPATEPLPDDMQGAPGVNSL